MGYQVTNQAKVFSGYSLLYLSDVGTTDSAISACITTPKACWSSPASSERTDPSASAASQGGQGFGNPLTATKC
ncbi:MAG: hypothetical protein HY040_21325 [Planctomycetes bacterium]|nr:hypothetical protein [Planctomycetota bacterium]